MKKISFRVRNFDKERFLTFNIDNNAELDDDLLDYLEDEEPEGIVPVIFEEGEEFDTFSYDITDKIRLSELSAQEINAEMVLKVLRGLVLSMMNMSEYRIPLSYLVLNRRYIYIDSEYKVEFVCIPLEDMKEEVDLTHFLRNFIASLRFEPSENGDYVAKLLTYVNNREMFNLHNLLELVEEWMDRFGIEIPEGESNEIYGEYTEIIDEVDDAVEEADSYNNYEDNAFADNTDSSAESADLEAEDNSEESTAADAAVEYVDSVTVDAADNYEESAAADAVAEYADSVTVDTADSFEENAVVDDFDDSAVDAVDNYAESTQDNNEYAKDGNEYDSAADDGGSIWESEKNATEQQSQEESVAEEPEPVEPETDKQDKGKDKKTRFKTKEAASVILEDELDAFLAEKEKEDHLNNNIKIKKGIKINRASIVQNTKEELEHSETEDAAVDETGNALENTSEDTVSDGNGSDKKDKKEKKTSKKESANKEPAKRKSRLRKGKEESADEEAKTSIDDAGIDETPTETAVEEENATEESTEAAKPAANPIPKVNPYLIRVNTDERIMINKQTFKIGKAGMGVDYTITGNGAISRVHAIITGKDGEYFIKDNKSTNHTFVNGKSVEEGESEKLTNNCKIVLGDEEFIFKEQ